MSHVAYANVTVNRRALRQALYKIDFDVRLDGYGVVPFYGRGISGRCRVEVRVSTERAWALRCRMVAFSECTWSVVALPQLNLPEMGQPWVGPPGCRDGYDRKRDYHDVVDALRNLCIEESEGTLEECLDRINRIVSSPLEWKMRPEVAALRDMILRLCEFAGCPVPSETTGYMHDIIGVLLGLSPFAAEVVLVAAMTTLGVDYDRLKLARVKITPGLSLLPETAPEPVVSDWIKDRLQRLLDE